MSNAPKLFRTKKEKIKRRGRRKRNPGVVLGLPDAVDVLAEHMFDVVEDHHAPSSILIKEENIEFSCCDGSDDSKG